MSCHLAPSASPRLLLFQHVEKTGGTSLREWLKTRSHNTARFGVVPYTSAACFLCRHRELALCPVPCHKDGPLLFSSIFASCDLMKSSVAVEFHASIGHALFQRLRPHLAELRRKYAAHNGTLRTLTILREPVAHMLSVFRMWPPRMPRRPPAGGEEYIEQVHRLRAAPLVPFDAWLPLASGLQCCALTAPFVARMPYGWTPSPPAEQRGCSPACHQRLAEFDLVGLTSCMPSVYRAVEAALALPTNTSLDALVTVVKAGQRRSQFAEGSALLAGTTCWSERALTPPMRAEARRVARVDRELYDAAAARSVPGCVAAPPPAETAPAAERCASAEDAPTLVREWRAAIARPWGEFARAFGLETTADWMLWETDEVAAKRHARAELNRNRTRGR